jgi:hypothetical protein
MTPLPAAQALDAYFLDARSRLLDLAAVLDRLDRGTGDVSADPRIGRIREAVAVLAGNGPGRAAKIQQVFSLGYDPKWPRPKPNG